MNPRMILICLYALSALSGCRKQPTGIPESYKEVDQVLWVVSDLENTMATYRQLGFDQVLDLGDVIIGSEQDGNRAKARLARANLGGALVNWIEPEEGNSAFRDFQIRKGDGAMALVHRFPDKKSMKRELNRLKSLGIEVLDDIRIETEQETIRYVLVNTAGQGKYVLGFTWGSEGIETAGQLKPDNRHAMKLNQYAFAIREPDPVSGFWQSIGLPAFQINHPRLGDTRYYGDVVDHELVQGWQRHGTIDYEWCIPVKPPIVYEDHILLHGEGIHHLAFAVEDMDKVLDDFTSRGFIVSMGGTWGEWGKPGSGRYEYIDLEEAGGVTMELLWNFKE